MSHFFGGYITSRNSEHSGLKSNKAIPYVHDDGVMPYQSLRSNAENDVRAVAKQWK